MAKITKKTDLQKENDDLKARIEYLTKHQDNTLPKLLKELGGKQDERFKEAKTASQQAKGGFIALHNACDCLFKLNESIEIDLDTKEITDEQRAYGKSILTRAFRVCENLKGQQEAISLMQQGKAEAYDFSANDFERRFLEAQAQVEKAKEPSKKREKRSHRERK